LKGFSRECTQKINLALKGEDYFLGRGLHPSLNKGFKKPLPKGRGLLYEIKHRKKHFLSFEYTP
jgi:hypothetical protein